MLQDFVGGLLAFIFTVVIMPFIIKIARQKNFYDLPNERKTHLTPIPSLGGIGIFIGLILTLLLTSDFTNYYPDFQYYLAGFFVLFIFGVLDDIFALSAFKKVLGQLAVATIMTVKGHLLLTSLHGFLGIGEVSPAVSYLITFFTILLIINSYNLIDGVDGLAGSLGLLSMLFFGVVLYFNHDTAHALLAFAMAGSLVAFLIFNFYPAKIFMGDSGSMLVGLVNAVLFIRFIETGSSISTIPLPSALTIGMGIILLPLMDVLRVFCIRIYHHRSPFSPDRNHIHHMLLNKGFTHPMVTFTLLLLSIFFTITSIAFQGVQISLAVFGLAAVFFLSVLLLKYTPPRRRWLRVVTNKDLATPTKDVKIVPIFTEETAVVKED